MIGAESLYFSAGTRGVLKWTENWMTFIDTVTQLAILGKRGLWLPLRYKTIVIDPGLQMRNIVQLNDGSQGEGCNVLKERQLRAII